MLAPLLLACSLPTVSVPKVAEMTDALAPDGWSRSGCSQARSDGVGTTACTFRRAEQVAVVTVLLYDVAADAARMWTAADAVGWRDGRVVVQVDVFDEAAAREVLGTLPDGEPEGFTCVGAVCQQDLGDRRVVVGPSRSGRPAAGYVAVGDRTAAVQDLELARELEERLHGGLTDAG